MAKHNYQTLNNNYVLPPVLNCDNITMDDHYHDRLLFHLCGVGSLNASYNDPTLWERVLDLRDWIWETLEDRFAKKAAADAAAASAGGGVVEDDPTKDDDQQLRLLGMDDDRATISLFGVTLCIRRPRQYEGPRSLPPSSSAEDLSVTGDSAAEAEYARYGVRPPRYSERSALLPQQPTLRSIRSEQPSSMQPMLIPTPNSLLFAPYAHASYHSTNSSGRSSPSGSITPTGSPPRRSSPSRSPPRSALCSSSKYGNNNANVLYTLWAALTGIIKAATPPPSGSSSPPKTVRFSIHNDVKEYTKAEWEPTDYYEPDFSHLPRQANHCHQKFEVRIHIGNNPPMIVKPIIVTAPRTMITTKKNRRRSSSSSTSSSDVSPPRTSHVQFQRHDRFNSALPTSRPVIAVA